MVHQAKSQPGQDGLVQPLAKGWVCHHQVGQQTILRTGCAGHAHRAGLFGTEGAHGLRGRCCLRHPGLSATAMVLLASSTPPSVLPEDAEGDDDDDGKETDHQAVVNNGDTTLRVLTIHLELHHS